MKYSTIPSAQTIVKHCKAKGISNIVISPGSRNAPLTLSFTEHPYFKCFSIVDERCAAFFALGIAQRLKEPVAVVCTSGSALLNYYPAIAEAFYSEVPLVVISADRPTYKIDVGDGQTIRQDHVFIRHIGYSANLKQDRSHSVERIKKYSPNWILNLNIDEVQKEIQEFNDSEINKAFNMALHQSLPVHINVPFEEPLYDHQSDLSVQVNIEHKEVPKQELLQLNKLTKIWNLASKKMILVGVNSPNTIEQEFLDKLGNDPSVIVLTETTSNLYHTNFFTSIDSLLAPIELQENRDEQFKELQPEILITFGGLIVSKKIKAFLRSYPPKYHWHVGDKRANNTFFVLEKDIKIDVNVFFRALLVSEKPSSANYYPRWDNVRKNYLSKRKEYSRQVSFSDFIVFDAVLAKIPENYQLHLANSSTIRYAQLFDVNKTIKVFCNRGTSGIDGSTSTAIGASIYEENPTLLITGDLSFFYDSNALWNSYIRKDFRIIVINNNGGGIFRILPGKEETDNFENYFETVHNLNASALCNMYGIGYQLVNDEPSLQHELSLFFEPSSEPKLLEIQTPRLLNDKILMDYFHFIS
ncbi:2-succinyl-5-enolpyruvyl-6-hydroxy-3-cyclohexene-1-carboxylate synthase [Maribacter sp. CXY002]|uniref:2-succinyl-5-enolpyruvyl-6-hydroxy-3- cyclohexene-1-carboxylate synthase n=1 Tax=Maribacter luteocoastalis TaxID=3407671 RepID=UPI003B671C02